MALIQIDVRGCACPEPVIKTKKALEGDAAAVEVLADNKIALQNIKRLASGKGWTFSFEKIDCYFKIIIEK